MHSRLKEFYREEFEKRCCCFCGIDISDRHFNAVSCSAKCRTQAGSVVKKATLFKSCKICDVELEPFSDRQRFTDICENPACRKEKDWRRNLYRIHHIRADQFYQMAEEQGWSCAVCKIPLMFLIDGSKPNINVDHDHSCCQGRIGCGGCVRGILCNGCNGGMGLFKDIPENLVSAANYLIRYREGKENG